MMLFNIYEESTNLYDSSLAVPNQQFHFVSSNHPVQLYKLYSHAHMLAWSPPQIHHEVYQVCCSLYATQLINSHRHSLLNHCSWKILVNSAPTNFSFSDKNIYCSNLNFSYKHRPGISVSSLYFVRSYPECCWRPITSVNPTTYLS